LHRFCHTARYWSKIADLNLPHLFLVPPLEFHRNFWHRQTRVPGPSYAVVCVILGFAILVQCQLVTDKRTDGHTTTAYIVLAQRRAAVDHGLKLAPLGGKTASSLH